MKMTDNDIIKALVCCNQLKWCNDCPLQGDNYCKDRLSDASVDLINQQKAKIEALQMDKEQLQSDIINANQNTNHLMA